MKFVSSKIKRTSYNYCIISNNKRYLPSTLIIVSAWALINIKEFRTKIDSTKIILLTFPDKQMDIFKCTIDDYIFGRFAINFTHERVEDIVA